MAVLVGVLIAGVILAGTAAVLYGRSQQRPHTAGPSPTPSGPANRYAEVPDLCEYVVVEPIDSGPNLQSGLEPAFCAVQFTDRDLAIPTAGEPGSPPTTPIQIESVLLVTASLQSDARDADRFFRRLESSAGDEAKDGVRDVTTVGEAGFEYRTDTLSRADEYAIYERSQVLVITVRDDNLVLTFEHDLCACLKGPQLDKARDRLREAAAETLAKLAEA